MLVGLILLLFAVDHFLVKVDEDGEVFLCNLGSLAYSVLRRYCTIGPYLQDKLVVIAAVADTGVLDGLLNLCYR